MKRPVWQNKSNGQLCVTIPKDSGFRPTDYVTINRAKIEHVIYTSITADMFHFGQLKLLQHANTLGDLHVCGILTDAAIKTYKGPPIMNFKERQAIAASLRCVDMTLSQKTLDPSDNVEHLQNTFPGAKITVVYGTNWQPIPGQKRVLALGANIAHHEFYDKLSVDNLSKKVRKKYGKEKDE